MGFSQFFQCISWLYESTQRDQTVVAVIFIYYICPLLSLCFHAVLQGSAVLDLRSMYMILLKNMLPDCGAPMLLMLEIKIYFLLFYWLLPIECKCLCVSVCECVCLWLVNVATEVFSPCVFRTVCWWMSSASHRFRPHKQRTAALHFNYKHFYM